MIANYGIEKWFKLQRYEGDEETYAELKLLGRRYLILSILVDTFFTRISIPKRQHPEIHSISVV